MCEEKKTWNSIDLGIAEGDKVLTGVLNLKHNSVIFFHWSWKFSFRKPKMEKGKQNKQKAYFGIPGSNL